MPHTTAILSLLHEPAQLNSATRLFRHQPVLAWTLARLARAKHLDSIAILCWDDQLAAVTDLAADAGAHVLVKSPRVPIPSMDAVSAALRWSDGWRGGLLGACHVDRGFHAPFALEALRELHADAAVLVDPAAALVDPQLIDALIDHAQTYPDLELYFTQAAPGLAGVLLRPALVERLARSNGHPGRLLAYSPDSPGRDPMTTDACLAVPAPIARTTQRFTLDSERQIRRFTAATADLNGHLIASDAQRILAILSAHPVADAHPRDVVLELTARRASRPIFAAATHLALGRGDLPLDRFESILAQLAGIDDLRLTLGGPGDPLLHPRFAEILQAISRSDIPAVHVETDLLDLSAPALHALTTARVDVLTLHLPAAGAATYQRVMGVDGYAAAIDNLKRLLTARRGLPIVVPTFTKCRENLADMEPWYDHWLRVLGAAVVAGPTDFAGQIPDAAAADMSPPRRRPCARLQTRMTIHSDAAVPSCEQDVCATQQMGHAATDRLAEIWQHRFAPLRADHQSNQLHARPLCTTCKEWHRP